MSFLQKSFSKFDASLEAIRLKLKPLSLAILCTTQVLDAVGLSGVNIAIPTLAIDLQMSTSTLPWVISAYALTYGGLMMLAGRLGDLYGHRSMFLVGLVIFAIFSLVCGFATSPTLFIIARALQGLGAAATVPNGLALITTSYEGQARERALGAFGSTAGLGFSVGLVLGGVFTSSIGWRWLFFFSAMLAGLQFVLGAVIIYQPVLEKDKSKSLDLLGAALITGGIVLIVYALTDASSRGWNSPVIISLLIVGFLLVVAFVVAEAYVDSPLMPLSVWTSTNFAPAFAIAFFSGGGMTTLLFYITQLWQNIRLQSALATALQLLVMSITFVISMPIATIVFTKIGIKWSLRVGLTLALILPLSLAFTDATVDFWTLPFLTWLPGFYGTATFFFCMTLAAVNSAPKEIQGVVGGLINTAPQVGSAVILSIAAAVVSSSTSNDPTQMTSDEILQGYHNAAWTVFGFYCLSWFMPFFIQDLPVPEAQDTINDVEQALPPADVSSIQDPTSIQTDVEPEEKKTYIELDTRPTLTRSETIK